jgi:hypothetical protein
MNSGRLVNAGKTRSCPHCKATILESASVCPGCHHHLRFDSAQRVRAIHTPLHVEGAIRHPGSGGPWEYSFVLAVRNGRGEEIARQVVGVGALQPSEERTFTVAVELFAALESKEPKPAAKEPTPLVRDSRPAGPPPLPPDPTARLAQSAKPPPPVKQPTADPKLPSAHRQVPPPLTQPKDSK